MSPGRLVGVGLLAAIGLAILVGPSLAPNPASEQHADMAYAPPMLPRIVHNGELAAPFVYPVTLKDRLHRAYEVDRTRPLRIRIGVNGRLLGVDAGETWLLLGGDPLGRDVFARLIAGGRLSLSVALLAVCLTLAIGGVAGAVAGFAGGYVDRGITTLADFVVVLPMVYAVVSLRAAMPLVVGNTTIYWTMVVVMALASWPLPARGVRAIIATERQKEYAEAAYSVGGTPLRILLRHLLPAAAPHLKIQGFLLFPAFIFAEATLSFIGLGFAEPQASWGLMLRDAERVSAMIEAPWLLAPAAAMVLTVVGIHLAIGSRDNNARSV